MRHLFIRNNNIMNLDKSSFVLVLSLSLLGCGEHHANVQTVSRDAVQQSSESKIQNPQTPSPNITPTPELEVTFGKGLKIVPKTVGLENQRRRYKIYVVYPHIEGSKSVGILKLNRRIKDLVTKQYQWPLIPPTKEDLRHYEKWPGVFDSVDLNYDVVLATDQLLSIYFEVYSYGIGAAHSVQQSFTGNFDVRSEKPITLAGLFKPQAKHFNFISSYCLGELSKDHDPIALFSGKACRWRRFVGAADAGR
ncbi:MAG TPA: hypothetical protein DCK93_18360 [Blastocatellia bacterium]|jgi:hypothetical protein|nr:hypothetical protein [Blastocatellia bacterium]HAF24838.1 hypothetical protein [Blastocatellia bacterium]